MAATSILGSHRIMEARHRCDSRARHGRRQGPDRRRRPRPASRRRGVPPAARSAASAGWSSTSPIAAANAGIAGGINSPSSPTSSGTPPTAVATTGTPSPSPPARPTRGPPRHSTGRVRPPHVAGRPRRRDDPGAGRGHRASGSAREGLVRPSPTITRTGRGYGAEKVDGVDQRREVLLRVQPPHRQEERGVTDFQFFADLVRLTELPPQAGQPPDPAWPVPPPPWPAPPGRRRLRATS